VTAALTASRRVDAGDPSFMNNVPDPLLAGKELPPFKFALEKSKGRVIGKSTAKEATVEQLPISKGIAGVSLEGTISMTMFGSHGRYRTETLEKGDIGYIPQGYGHSIEDDVRDDNAQDRMGS
jgi:oxalate decarboxylase